jgi:squalene monooxygenase
MTVAFNDAVLLSELFDPAVIPALDDHASVLSAMRTFHWRRKNLTAVINILAQALYALFAAEDAQLRALQQGCFEYFKLGGNCIDGPVGLLGGIIRQPFVLFYHFFAVALLSIWLYIVRGKTVLLPVRALGSVGVFFKACQVLFPYIFAELRS